MRDPLLERLIEIAMDIAGLLGTEEEAEQLVEEVVEIIEEASTGTDGRWGLPELEDVVSKQLLHALKLVLGKDHPVRAVMQCQESSASAIRLESTIGDELWKVTAKKYPPQLVRAMQAGQPFSPQALGAPPKKGGVESPSPLDPWMTSAFCNIVFLAFCDASMGERDGIRKRKPLLRLLLQDNIFPIGFSNGGRIVIVPVQG